jgi:ribonuclease D
MSPHKNPPCKADIDELEPFAGLELDSVFVVTNERQAKIALEELMRTGAVGFDTESKPTFHKGQKSEGPHVLQFATLEKAFIFQSHVAESHPVIVELLKSTELTKIGFGLSGDLRQIADRFGIRPACIVDLDRSFKKLGYRNAVGAKSAVAMLFNRKLTKSKSVTTSNWSARELSDRQLLYAANDAYAAIQIFHALENDRACGSWPSAPESPPCAGLATRTP